MAAASAASTNAKEHVLQQLARTDVGNTGIIPRSELSLVFRRLGPNWTEDKVDALMDIMDIQERGYIRYHDFVEWVFSEGAVHSGLEGFADAPPGSPPGSPPSRPMSATQSATRLRLRKAGLNDEAGVPYAAGGAIGAIRVVSKDARLQNLRSASSPALSRDVDSGTTTSAGGTEQQQQQQQPQPQQPQRMQVGTPPVQAQMCRRVSSAGRRSAAAGRKRADHNVTFSTSAIEAGPESARATLSGADGSRPHRRVFLAGREDVERVCQGLKAGVSELQQHALNAAEVQEARLDVKNQASQTPGESVANTGVTNTGVAPSEPAVGEDADTLDKSRYALLSQLVAVKRQAESASLRASATDDLMQELHMELRRRQEEADVFAARDFQPIGAAAASQDPETERLPGGDHSTSVEASGYPLLTRLGALCNSWQDCAAQHRTTARAAEERAATSAFDAALAQRNAVTAEEAAQVAKAAEAVSADLAAAARTEHVEQSQELARLRSELQELEEREHLRREVLTDSATEATAEASEAHAKAVPGLPPQPEAVGQPESDVFFGEVLRPEHGIDAALDRLRHLLGGVHGKLPPSPSNSCTSIGGLAEALGDLEDGAALMRGQLLAAQNEVQNLATTCLQLRVQLASACNNAEAATARMRERGSEEAAAWSAERRELKTELQRAKRELRGAVQANQLAQTNLNMSRSCEARATAEMQLLRAELDRLDDGRYPGRPSHFDLSSGGSGATLTYSSEQPTDAMKQPLSHSVLQVTGGANSVAVLSAFSPKAARAARTPKDAAWARERAELRSELVAARQDAAWAKERCEVQEELARTRSELAAAALSGKDSKRSKKVLQHPASGSGSEALLTPTDAKSSPSQLRRPPDPSRQHQLPASMLAGLNDSGATPHWGGDMSLEFHQVASWMREKSELQSELARARQDLGGTVQAAIATRECLNETRASEALAQSELRAMRVEMERLAAAVAGGSPPHPLDLSAIPLSGTMPTPPQVDVGAGAMSILSGSEDSEAGSALAGGTSAAQSTAVYMSSGPSVEPQHITFKANMPGAFAAARPAAVLATDPQHHQAPPSTGPCSPANQVLNSLLSSSGAAPPPPPYFARAGFPAGTGGADVSASSANRSHQRKQHSRSKSGVRGVRSPAGGASSGESTIADSKGSS